jgi:hypothetical protein
MTIRTATQADNAPAGAHGAGGGLYLKKPSDEPKSGSWVYRYRLGGKRREMGLGSFAALTLAEARKSVRDLAAQRDKGCDPIEARRKDKAANLAASRAASPVTFRQAADAYLKDFAPTWKHRRAVQDWLNPLARYAFPVIGDLPLNEIQVEHVRAVLRAAIKAGAPENGRRVRQRIEAVLDDAELKASATRPAATRPRRRRTPSPSAPRATARITAASSSTTRRRRSAKSGSAPRPIPVSPPGVHDRDGGAAERSARRPLGRDRPRQETMGRFCGADEGRQGAQCAALLDRACGP